MELIRNRTLLIILPTIRPDHRICGIIQSIFSQAKDIENIGIQLKLLLVLNGPREPYFSFLSSLLSDPAIRAELIYIEIPGVSRARNVGLQKANDNDFVLFVDDDDSLSQNYLFSLVRSIRSDDEIVQSNTCILRQDGTVSHNHYINQSIRSILSHSECSYDPFKYRRLLNSVCGKLFPKKLIGNVKFDDDVAISEDALFLFTLSPRIKNISVVTNEFYQIRERPDSASRRSKPISSLIGDSLKFIFKLSQVYWKAPLRFSFLLYVSRILASLKFLIIRMKNQL